MGVKGMEEQRTGVERHAGHRLGEIHPYLAMFDLWIVDLDEGAFDNKVADKGYGRGFACIACVGLESESEHSDPLYASNMKIYWDRG